MNLSLLQWNVWYREDIRHILQFLRQIGADIVCLQELTVGARHQPVENTTTFIAQGLGYSHHCKELPIEAPDGSKETFVNGIFSRFPITSKRTAWINEPKSGGGYADEYRAYVEATLSVPGHELTVGTTHMSYTHRFGPTRSKQAETDRLLQLVKKNTGQFVFAGT